LDQEPKQNPIGSAGIHITALAAGVVFADGFVDEGAEFAPRSACHS